MAVSFCKVFRLKIFRIHLKYRCVTLSGILHFTMMETRDEIDARLNLYHQQLQQVNQLLTLDGQNAQFLSLKSDLEKVISLTSDLVKQQKVRYFMNAINMIISFKNIFTFIF